MSRVNGAACFLMFLIIHLFWICRKYSSKRSRRIRTIFPILYTAPASLAIRVKGFISSFLLPEKRALFTKPFEIFFEDIPVYKNGSINPVNGSGLACQFQ